MKIAVCLKLIPSPAADIRPLQDGSGVRLEDLDWVLNPSDELALETALVFREQRGADTQIFALSAGGEDALRALRHAFAYHVDEGIWVRQDAGCDTLNAARCCAAALRRIQPDVILCGTQAEDDGLRLFPGALAGFLELPYIPAARRLEMHSDSKSVLVRRACDEGEAVLAVKLPAVLGCAKGLPELRIANIKARMAAKKRTPQCWTMHELGIAQTCPMGHLCEPLYSPPPPRPPGRMLTGPLQDAARELAKVLRNEAGLA